MKFKHISDQEATASAIWGGARRVHDNIGCYITYIRGGARKDEMARACRRFTAGERATASHARTEPRRNRRKTMRCVKGPTSRTNRQVKRKQNIKILKSNETLSSPHDQRMQRGGGRREGGGSRGASRPEVYRVVLNVSVGIPTPGRRR